MGGWEGGGVDVGGGWLGSQRQGKAPFELKEQCCAYSLIYATPTVSLALVRELTTCQELVDALYILMIEVQSKDQVSPTTITGGSEYGITAVL